MKKSFEKPVADVRSILEKAENFIKSKNYRKAVEELEKHKIRSVDYFLLLAEAYEGLGNSEKAEFYLEEARFLDTELRSKEKLRKGITLASMKNFRAAEQALLESVKLNPFERDAYYELYRLYRETGNHKKMVETLQNLMTIDPFSSFPYLELSRLYALRRQYKKAVEVLRFGLERIDLPELHFELGKVLADMGKVEEAKEELSEACRQDFLNVEYRQKLAEVMVNDEDYEGALQVVMSTLELYPDAVYVIQSAAALYDLLGNEELAEYYYRLAISKSEGFVREDSLKLFSEFLAEKGRYDQAEEILREIIDTTDNLWILLDAFSELAIILVEQERYKDIVEIGKKLMKHPELTEEDYCEIAEIVADALYEDKNYEEALKYYREIVSYSKDEKLIKRSYSKLKEIEEILSLERML
ncbi:tetratricopeptide repeat protein [Phorcysia thermohydrogeniphila]|uniref:Lipopolysaccharide biosynthesis regulator YciM n=1 Tax=Phorcysia thermohydrogeniphila TaxID=936138 RepID=A0A4R1G4C5_9BACT|nr:tetratricopeptide repeat protein [Phorcysia thermohydrogeniphila]TCK02494.1 lipopolysaccharide biosynthesis regulator YciM [Phorcysia thermohydrogeniphila]